MSLDPDLRSSLIELVLTLEELLTRPLREQHYQPDLGKVAAICHLAQALEHSTPQWCPPEVLGERLRMRQRARLERAPFSPRRPRA
jgi:hypothetical protein